MPKHYLVYCVLAILCLSGCDGLGNQEPTAVPFAIYNAQQVIQAFRDGGAPVSNITRNMVIGSDRGVPATFSDRYVFEIPRIAPLGGQILVFDRAEDMQAWVDYIASLRQNQRTRRDVVYVYTRRNVMIQLNAALTATEARQFENIFTTLP
jgi:hypothetical protein